MRRGSVKGNQLTSWLAEWSASFSFYPVRKWHVNRILVEAGFYFCQWLETCKKEKRGLFILAYQDAYLQNKDRKESFWILWWSPWVLKIQVFSPPARSCWVAAATWLLPHNPVRLTGYRFSSKGGQDQNPNLGHWLQKGGLVLRPRTAQRPSAGLHVKWWAFGPDGSGAAARGPQSALASLSATQQLGRPQEGRFGWLCGWRIFRAIFSLTCI